MRLQQQYEAQITNGVLQADVAQKTAIDRLDAALQVLEEGVSHIQGLYLYGPVGRGKSMVMNLFFEQAPEPKRRVHFHAFMEELHGRMHALPVQKNVDPMDAVVLDIKEEAQLLCFDEFYITNIADAMLLGRLFQKFFEHGVLVVATSNWPPEELFQGGVNRDRFLPFIKLIMKHMDAVEVAGEQDYRLLGQDGWPLWHVGEGTSFLNQFWESFTTGCERVAPANVTVFKACGRVAWCRFEDMCGMPLDREHYLYLADQFDFIILEDVPLFPEKKVDEAIRFITLVDILYEKKCPLICSAIDVPAKLCTKGDAAQPFLRTVSRLHEMQGWVES